MHMEGLSVLVENFITATLIHIFETNTYEGHVVPMRVWNPSQVVDLHGASNFILMSIPPKNDREFPTYINTKTGTNSNKETDDIVDHYIVSKRIKYYRGQESTTVSIRLYKVVSTLTKVIKYIYHYQIKPTQGRNLREVPQAVMNNVGQNPGNYSPRAPQISSITPNTLEYECGKQQTIEINGADLYPTEGFLYPVGLVNFSESSCIRLMIFVAPGSGFKSMIIRFQHPFNLSDRFYYPVFKINDNYISFNQCLIEFTDSATVLGESSVRSGYDVQSPYTVPDSLYPTPGGFLSMSLMDSISFGSPRHLSTLSKVYPDGIPDLFPKSKKCFSNASIDTKSISLIGLAAHFGELCTLLYLVVWDLETCGILDASVRMRLDKYLCLSKLITYDGMMDSLKGESDELDKFHSEQQIREFASQSKNSTGHEHENIYRSYATDYYVSYTDNHSLEAYFTNDVTPSHLIDPITGVLYNYPVILPSGKTVSIQLAKVKPRFDVFAHKAFEPEQSIILNRHLIDCVDDYISANALLKMQEMKLSLDRFKEAIFILTLLQNRQNLNATSIAVHQFASIFWANLNIILPFISELTKKERKVQFEMLLRGTFPREMYISRLSEEKCEDNVTALCKLFPSPMDAYEILNLRQMLSNVAERTLATIIVDHFLHTCATNLLEMYYQQQDLAKDNNKDNNNDSNNDNIFNCNNENDSYHNNVKAEVKIELVESLPTTVNSS